MGVRSRPQLANLLAKGSGGPGGAGFLLATTFVNISGFAFHLTLSRLLGPAHYGALAALIGVVSVLSLPLAALETSVAQATAELLAAGDRPSSARLLRHTVCFGGGASAIWLAYCIPVSRFLHVSFISAAVIAFWVFFAGVVAVAQGVLVGSRRFHPVSLSQFVGPALARLGFAVVAVELGAGIVGAVAASGIGSAICLGILVMALRDDRGGTAISLRSADVVRSMSCIGGVTLLTSIDGWVARHFLTPVDAGFFGAASTAARISLFLPSAIALIMFSRLARSEGRGTEAHRALGHAVLATALLSLVSTLVISADPPLVIHLLFGKLYEPSSAVVRIMSAADGLAAVSSVLLYFLLSRRERSASIAWGGCGLALLLTIAFHGTAVALASDMLAASAALVVGLLVLTARAIASDNARNQETTRPGWLLRAGSDRPPRDPVLRRLAAHPSIVRIQSGLTVLDRLSEGASASAMLMLGVPTLLFTLVPLALWTGFFGHRMALGGDDSLLYYYQPGHWIHAPLSVLDNGFSGFNPRFYLLPFILVLVVLHWLPLNTEGLAFGLLLGSTFLGTAKLAALLAEPPSDSGARRHAGPLLAGIVATCAPLVLESQSHYLLGIYWRALLPWMAIFFARHQRTGRTRWLVAGAALSILLSAAIMQEPWSLGALPLLVALAILASLRRRLLHWRRAGAFVGCLILLNAFWIYPLFGLLGHANSQLTGATSSAGTSAANQIVDALARVQSPADALGLRMSSTLLRAYGTPYAAANGWSDHLWPLGLIPLLAVLAGVIGARRISRRQVTVLGTLVFLSLAYLYLSTLGLLPDGVALFDDFVTHVPLGNGVRNFYDKFAIPYAAVFALAAGVGLALATRRLTRGRAALVASLAALCFVVYALPHLGGAEFRDRFQGSESTRTRDMDGLPATYLTLLRDLRSLPDGAVLTLPLAAPAWTPVPSADGRGLYLGISPIFYLTGRSDYDGLSSFASPALPSLGSEAETAFGDGDLASVRQLVGLLGIRYVVVNTTPEADPVTYGVGFTSAAVERQVTQEVVQDVAPQVVARSGPWQVYEVRSSVAEPMVSTVGVSASPMSQACSTRQPSAEDDGGTSIEVKVAPSSAPCQLVLRRPYDNGWVASSASDRISPDERTPQGLNSFVVGPHRSELNLSVEYRPQSSFADGLAVSGAALLCMMALGTWRWRRRRLAERGPHLATDP